MPTVLDFNQQQGTSGGGAPDVSPQKIGSGEEYAAIAGVGRQLQAIGGAFLEAKKRAEDTDSVNQALQEDFQLLQKMDEEKGQYLDGGGREGLEYDPRGYSSRVIETLEERRQKVLEKLPSPTAQREYDKAANSMFNNFAVRAKNFEDVETAKMLDARTKKFASNLAVMQENSPNRDALIAGLKRIDDIVQNDFTLLGQSAADAQKVSADMKRQMIAGYFRGQIAKNPGVLTAMLETIRETPDASFATEEERKGRQIVRFSTGEDATLVTEFFTGAELGEWRARDQAEANKGKSNLKSRYLERIRDNINSLKAGDPLVPAADIADTAQLINAFSSLNKDRPEENSGLGVELMSAAAVHKVSTSMGAMSVGQLRELPNDLSQNMGKVVSDWTQKLGIPDHKQSNAAAQAAAIKFSREAVERKLKAYSQDPVAEIVVSDESTKELFQASGGGFGPSSEINSEHYRNVIAMQESLGIDTLNGGIRLLDSKTAKVQAEKMNIMNSMDAAAEVVKLRNTQGPYFERVLGELNRDGKLNDYFMTAAWIDPEQNATLMQRIVDVKKNKKAYDEEISDLIRRSGINETDFKNEVTKQFAKIRETLTVGGRYGENISIAQTLQSVLEANAASIADQNTGLSWKDAVSQSKQELFGQYETYKKALIPSHTKQFKDITSKMDVVNSDEWVEANVDKIMFGGSLDAPVIKPGMKPHEIARAKKEAESRISNNKDRMLNALTSADHHAWITRPDMSGADLAIYDPALRSYVPLKWKDGTKIYMDYNRPVVPGILQKASPVPRVDTKAILGIQGQVKPVEKSVPASDGLVRKNKSGSIEYDYPGPGKKFSEEEIKMLRDDHKKRLDALARPDHRKILKDQFRDLTGEDL